MEFCYLERLPKSFALTVRFLGFPAKIFDAFLISRNFFLSSGSRILGVTVPKEQMYPLKLKGRFEFFRLFLAIFDLFTDFVTAVCLQFFRN